MALHGTVRRVGATVARALPMRLYLLRLVPLQRIVHIPHYPHRRSSPSVPAQHRLIYLAKTACRVVLLWSQFLAHQHTAIAVEHRRPHFNLLPQA